MHERQTQVLAVPARAEGSDRETEGILTALWAEIQGMSKNSRWFHAGPADVDPCQTCEVHTGWKRECCSRFLSDGLSQTPSCEVPPSLACLLALTLPLLAPSLLFALSLLAIPPEEW